MARLFKRPRLEKTLGRKTSDVWRKKIETLRDGYQYTFIISNANYSWRKWLPVLGDFVEVGASKFSLQYEDTSINFNVDTQADKEIISLRVPELDRRMIKFLSQLKNVLNKAAYCRNCRDCMIECPHGALTITAGDVQIKNCRHCYRYYNLHTKKLTDYRGFGLKKEWLKIFFDNPQNFDKLGTVMIPVFKIWGKHGGLLDKKNLSLEVVEKFISLGADNLRESCLLFQPYQAVRQKLRLQRTSRQ